MRSEQILGKREDVAAILKALGIREKDKPSQPEQNGSTNTAKSMTSKPIFH